MQSILAEFVNWRRNVDGVPIPPTKVPLKPQELEEIEPECTGVHVKVFRLDRPEDVAEYEKVLNGLIHNANVRVGSDLVQFVPEFQTWLVTMRYAEIRGKIPQHILDMEVHYDA